MVNKRSFKNACRYTVQVYKCWLHIYLYLFISICIALERIQEYKQYENMQVSCGKKHYHLVPRLFIKKFINIIIILMMLVFCMALIHDPFHIATYNTDQFHSNTNSLEYLFYFLLQFNINKMQQCRPGVWHTFRRNMWGT